MRAYRPAFFVMALTLLLHAPAGAQGPSPSRPFAARSDLHDTLRIQPGAVAVDANPNHAWEGAIIGAAITGLLGAAVMAGLCGHSDTGRDCGWENAKGFILLAPVGLVIGGMIGARFPK